MYFPREGTNTPEELSRLGEAWDDFRKAETALKAVLHKLGQDFEGGRKLAKQISSGSSFTRTPFVFFTRKGNLLDAITAYEETKAVSVIKKPDPREEFAKSGRQSAYDKAMIENKDNLIRLIKSAIQRGHFWYRYGDYILTFVSGMASSVVVWFITTKVIS